MTDYAKTVLESKSKGPLNSQQTKTNFSGITTKPSILAYFEI